MYTYNNSPVTSNTPNWVHKNRPDRSVAKSYVAVSNPGRVCTQQPVGVLQRKLLHGYTDGAALVCGQVGV